MISLLRTSIVASLCLLIAAAGAQSTTPADRIHLAAGTYYTPTASGLESFHCAVSIDWKDLLTRFGGGGIPDTDPRLQYLRTIKLSVDDDLQGAGKLNWVAPSDPPEDAKTGVDKMHGGMAQMIGGFFQSWNPFMNGSYLPQLDPKTTVTSVSDGYLVHAGDASMTVEENFDKNILLTKIRVTNAALDVTAYPTYADTPKGRIFSSLRSELHQPPTAPATEVTMATTYATTSGFQLPANLSFTVPNVGTFYFKLSACTVKTTGKAPGGF